MAFYEFYLKSVDNKRTKDFNEHFFEKIDTINPEKTYEDVLIKMKNAMTDDLIDRIQVDGVALGYIWDGKYKYIGTLYIDEKYEDCLKISGMNFKLLEKSIMEKRLQPLCNEKKDENYNNIKYKSFDELLSIINKEITVNFPKEVYQGKATDNQIKDAEARLNSKLPESFKKFITKISNGMELFNTESILSTQELRKTNYKLNAYFDKPTIKVKDRGVIDSNQLISFTKGEFIDSSASHWVFICDKEYPDNEYPVGYITQSKANIVQVLDGGFKEWLETFWKGYEFGKYKTVFSILHSDWYEMESLWSLDW